MKGLEANKSGFQDVRSRILFVLFAIFILRLGSHIPVPGIDHVKLAAYFANSKGGLFGLLNVFSGGSLSRMSVFTLSVSPYISASIVINILSFTLPSLEQLRKEGGRGKHKLTRYTRLLALAVAFIQSIPVTRMMISNGIVINPSLMFFFVTAVTLATGTFFLIWLGEQITERGIGNGISMIIFAGITSRFPEAVGQLFGLARTGEMNILVFASVLAAVAVITGGVVYCEKAQRQIKLTHPSRHQARASQMHSLPLKLNMAGVIPPICASILLMTPLSIINSFMGPNSSYTFQMFIRAFSPGQPFYIMAMVASIALFSFIYTSMQFNPHDIAENLKRQSVIIPGMRPGLQTSKHLDDVMRRITLAGIIYLSVVVLIPEVFVRIWQIPFYFGGTSLLIVVVVVMDFMSQMYAHLLPDRYANLMGKPGKGGTKKNLQLFR